MAEHEDHAQAGDSDGFGVIIDSVVDQWEQPAQEPANRIDSIFVDEYNMPNIMDEEEVGVQWIRRLMASVVLLAILAASAVGAPPDQARYLNIPKVNQLPDGKNWCWAASGVSILRYFGITNVTMCMFVSKAITGSTNPLICNDVQGTDGDIRYSLSYFCV